MGLAERRAIKEFEDNIFPSLKRKIDEAAGFEVDTEVHWEKLAVEGQAERYTQDWYISDIFFKPLIEALKQVASDEMGKQALKSGLKKVVVTYDPDTAPISNYEDGWPFNEGVLTINYQPGVNSGENSTGHTEDRIKAIRKNLESGL